MKSITSDPFLFIVYEVTFLVYPNYYFMYDNNEEDTYNVFEVMKAQVFQ